MKKFSLDDLYYMVSNIYYEQNYQRSVTATFTHFVEVCGMLTAHSRNKNRDNFDFESALCKALGWYFPLLSKCGVRSLEQIIYRKFPYVCPYCRREPHKESECKVVKGTERTVNHPELIRMYNTNLAKKPVGLNEWQKMFNDIYERSPNDNTKSTIGLMEELGELAEAIRIYDRHPKFFAGEVADVFSYIMGLANEYSIKLETAGLAPFDFEKEFLKRYPGLCLACGNMVCTCPAIPEATIGRMTKELDISVGESLFGITFEEVKTRGTDTSYDVIEHIGGISSIVKNIPLDRGQVNQSLVFVCIKISEMISETNPELSNKLREAAIKIGSGTTPAGGKIHNNTINSFLSMIREAIRQLPDKANEEFVNSENRLISEVSKMVGKYRVLLVAASPMDQGQVNVGGEARQIVNSIKQSCHKDNISIELAIASTIDDFRRHLLDREYEIIHFCGHGDNNCLCFMTEGGTTEVLTLHVLKDMLSRYENIKVVILNACSCLETFTESLAPITIGMKNLLSDQAAIEFSKGFYDAVGAGKTIAFAIEEGKITAKSHGFDDIDLPIKILHQS